MSVERRELPSGAVTFVVRWREGGRARSRNFPAAKLGGERAAGRIAGEFEVEVNKALRTGGLAPTSMRQATLADAIADWLPTAGARLTQTTYDSYMATLKLHVIPQLGDRPVAAITPADVEDWANARLQAGVGPATVRRAGAILSSVMQRAVKARAIPSNPVRDASLPSAPREREPVFITPLQVEQIRAWLLERDLHGDAVMVSLLAYAGLRPESEAWPLLWSNVGERTIHVPAIGKRGSTARDVELIPQLAADLAEWRAVAPSRKLVIPADGTHVGGTELWTKGGWKNWRRRAWLNACKAAGVPEDARPRDLRNGFATLLIYEGRPVTEVARQLGHSPTMTLNTYARVFAEFDRRNQVRATTAIKRARAQVAGLQVVA